MRVKGKAEEEGCVRRKFMHENKLWRMRTQRPWRECNSEGKEQLAVSHFREISGDKNAC